MEKKIKQRGYGKNGTKKRLGIIAEELTMLSFLVIKAIRTLEDDGILPSLSKIDRLIDDLQKNSIVLKRGKNGISNG